MTPREASAAVTENDPGDDEAHECESGPDAPVIVANGFPELPPPAKSAAPAKPSAPWAGRVVPVAADWFTTAPPAREWLLRDGRAPNTQGAGAGVLPRGEVGQLISEGGIGKTMVLCQVSVSVASGSRWLGALDVVHAGRVLLALGEESAAEAQRRLYRAARVAKGTAPEPGSIVVLPLRGVPCPLIERDASGNQRDTEFAKWLRAYLKRTAPWSLVVIDPLSRFAGPDAETDNAAATRFDQSLEALAAEAAGATTLNAHHTNKLSRDGTGRITASAGRGASALVDGARWQAGLGVERIAFDDPDVRMRLGEVVTLHFTKSNYGYKADPIELRRDLDNGGALVPLDDTDRALVSEARHAASIGGQTRAAKTAAKESETRKRDADDDAAARKIVAAAPGASVRALVGLLRGARSCGGDRAHAAITRVRSEARA